MVKRVANIEYPKRKGKCTFLKKDFRKSIWLSRWKDELRTMSIS